MNASIRGVMFVKADRITQRVRKAGDVFKRMHKSIPKDKIDDFIKTVEIIVNDELTDKGVERRWRDLSAKQENSKVVYLQDYTKEHTSWLKTLMMKLRLWK